MSFSSRFLVFILCFSGVIADTRPISGSCETPRSGLCVNIWKCPYYAQLLRRTGIPRPFPIIKNLRKNLCGFVDKDTPEVCCNLATNNIKPRPIVFNQTDNEDPTNHPNLKLLPWKDCGPVLINSRITEGEQTSPFEFPWMALIAYKTDDGLAEFRCGGTLINENYILTAAHCIDNDTILGVRLGEYNTLTDVDCDSTGQCKPPVQDFGISSITVHSEYDPESLLNDIALIRLKANVKYIQRHIEPICLPLTNLIHYNLDRRHALVAGWGVTEKGDKSNILLKVTIPVIPIIECRLLYQNFKPITDSQICAGGKHGKDSCGGDSGGPLKYINNLNGTARFVQYGIVSYGPRYCGMDGRPGIYTKITKYLKWILDNIMT